MNIHIGVLHIHIGREQAPRWADELEGRIIKELRKAMTKIEEKLNAFETALTTIGEGVVGVRGDVEAMGVEIQSLKDQIANGGMTPEIEARFDALVTKASDSAAALTALDALNPATPGGDVS